MTSVTVEYFARLREERGCDSETIETEAKDLLALYEALSEAHGFSLPSASLLVAVNEQVAAWDSPLNEGDVVVFLPPVAGG